MFARVEGAVRSVRKKVAGSPPASKPPVETGPATGIADTKSSLRRGAELVQSILTSVAIVVGGGYALYQSFIHRETAPIIDLTQEVTSRRVSSDYQWVHVEAIVHNIGKVAVTLPNAKILMQQILPLGAGTGEAVAQRKSPFSGSSRIVQWAPLCQFEHTIDFYLEPTEFDFVTFDAFIPAGVRTVKVFSFVPNPEKPKEGWQRTSIYDFPKEDGNADTQAGGNPDVHPLCPGN